MNKVLFLLTLARMLAPVLLHAQKDTIFLDGRFRPADKKNARYFRFVDFTPGKNKYKITNYFLDGKIQTQTQHIPAGCEVKWPVVFDYDFNAQLNNANGTIKYIEKSTGVEIASCTIADRKKYGFEIEEADGYFQLYYFRYSPYTDKSFKALTFNQLLEKIEAWKLE